VEHNRSREGLRNFAPTVAQHYAGRSAITPELPVKLEKAIGSTADVWLRMQSAHDLAKVRSRAIGSKIKRFEPV